MMIFRFEVNAPERDVLGIKECLAMELERFGDVRLVSVETAQPPGQGQQLSMWAAQRGNREAAARRR